MADLETRLHDALHAVGEPAQTGGDADAWHAVDRRLDGPDVSFDLDGAGLVPSADRRPRPRLRVPAIAAAIALAVVALVLVASRPTPTALVLIDDPTLPRYLLDPPDGFTLDTVTDPVDVMPMTQVVGLRTLDAVPTSIGVQVQQQAPNVSGTDVETVAVGGGTGQMTVAEDDRQGFGAPHIRLWWQEGDVGVFLMAIGPRGADRDLVVSVANAVHVRHAATGDAPATIGFDAVPDGVALTFDGPGRQLAPSPGYTLDYSGRDPGDGAPPSVSLRVDRGGLSPTERATLYGLEPVEIGGRSAFVGASGIWVYRNLNDKGSMVVLDLGGGVTATVSGWLVPRDELVTIAGSVHRVSEGAWVRATRGKAQEPSMSATTSSLPPSTTSTSTSSTTAPTIASSAPATDGPSAPDTSG